MGNGARFTPTLAVHVGVWSAMSTPDCRSATTDQLVALHVPNNSIPLGVQ